MLINTTYQPTDEVWKMHDNKPAKFIVTEVYARATPGGDDNTPRITISYTVRPFMTATQPSQPSFQDDLFPSKESLLAHLATLE